MSDARRIVNMNVQQSLSALIARLNAKRLKIRGSVPPRSIVRGRGLTIGRGFFASGPIWLEAVHEYDGVAFSPVVRVGENVRTSPRLHISGIREIVVGDWCLFGENVFVSDHQHGATNGDDQCGPETPPAVRPLAGAHATYIGDRCHLGNNVVVLPGANIGAGSIIGANSVVSGPIPANSIAVGAPARVVKQWDESVLRWIRTD